MPINKKFTIKLYAKDGTTLIEDLKTQQIDNRQQGKFPITNSPTFASEINQTFGNTTIEMIAPFDNYREGGLVNSYNWAEIYYHDEDNKDGGLVYKGVIHNYISFTQGASEGVRLELVSYAPLLFYDYFKDGASFDVVYTTTDPSQIIKDIIDHFNTIQKAVMGITNDIVLYDIGGTTIDITGQSVDITISKRKHLEAIQDVASLITGNYYWTIDAEGVFYLKPKPTSATHTFNSNNKGGAEGSGTVDKIETHKTAQEVINSVAVIYATGTETYDDATSQSKYYKRGSIIEDSQITSASTAQAKAQAEVEKNKDIKIASMLEINTKYPLETIKVGDTCKLRNLNENDTTFNDNMQIVKIDYKWDAINIELESVQTSSSKEFAKFIEQTI